MADYSMTRQEVRRMAVLRAYYGYVRALGNARLNHDDPTVQEARAQLTLAIEDACDGDPWLLHDFKRAFAARR